MLAGDIATDNGGTESFRHETMISPVIYVPGNCEYHSWRSREGIDDNWRAFASLQPRLNYLVGEAVTINGVRFWGGPWYSDLFDRRDPGHLDRVGRCINDFQDANENPQRWTVQRHLEALAQQTRLLHKQAGLVDVVVTHWPRTTQAIPPRLRDDLLNGYFVNDREDLVEEIGAQPWISANAYGPYDVRIGETRCIANPNGCPGEVVEGEGFQPDRVIELRRRRARGFSVGRPGKIQGSVGRRTILTTNPLAPGYAFPPWAVRNPEGTFPVLPGLPVNEKDAGSRSAKIVNVKPCCSIS